MGEPTTENRTANVVNDILEIAIMEVGLRLAKAAAIAEVPILGTWPISMIFDYLLKKLGRYFYLGMATFSTFKIIDEQTRGQRERYDASIDAVHRAVVANDPIALEKAREEFKKRLADLIHWNGEARP